MNGEELRKALHEGERVYGTAVLSTAPHWVPVIRSLGLDFVFIDNEHTPIDRQTCAWMVQAFEASGIAALVRIPNADPDLVRAPLDSGASGIVAPYVEEAENVRRLAAAIRLRPLKGRRLRSVMEGEALPAELDKYLDRFNKDKVLIANIESLAAIENLDEIVRVPGLDAVLIGPHDLTVSMGQPEQYDAPEFDEKVRDIIRRARDAGIGAGGHFWHSLEKEIGWIKAGANLILHAGDFHAVQYGLRREFDAIRSAVEGTIHPRQTGEGSADELTV